MIMELITITVVHKVHLGNEGISFKLIYKLPYSLTISITVIPMLVRYVTDGYYYIYTSGLALVSEVYVLTSLFI